MTNPGLRLLVVCSALTTYCLVAAAFSVHGLLTNLEHR